MLRRLLANALALGAATVFLPGIVLTGSSLATQTLTLLGVALIFGILNALVKPVLTFFSAPMIILSLGLFLVVLNTIMLLLTSWACGLVGLGFYVDGWMNALLGSLIISAVSWAVCGIANKKREQD